MAEHRLEDKLYKLNSQDELEAWDTHEIRSHRRQRKYSDSKAVAFCVAVCLSAIAVTTNVTFSEPQKASTHAQVTRTPTATLTGPETSPTKTTDQPTEPREVPARASRQQQERPSPTEIAISFALSQVGKRYVFGASGPNSFDCSGLVLRAFQQIGISLPHYTGTMVTYGKRVSQSEMIRGDIVFPSSNHVGIYLGQNQMVVASSGKGKIIVQNVYSFYTARRLL